MPYTELVLHQASAKVQLTMAHFPIRYQASLFTNAGDISPHPKNLIKLLPAFEKKAMIATTVMEMGGSAVGTPFVNRLRLASENGWNGINFLSSRIDFERSLLVAGKQEEMGIIENFLIEIEEDIKAILGAFPRKAHRLAVVAKYGYDDMAPEKLAAAYAKLFSPTPYFAAHQPFEWNWRSAGSDVVTLEAREEPCNAILSVSRASGEILGTSGDLQQFDKIMLDIDLNTKPVNTDLRFGAEHVEPFFIKATQYHYDMLAEIDALLK